MNSINLLKEHCKFGNDYDCYVLLAVSRKKDTPEITNSQEIVFREVIKREEDIIRKYNKIKAMCTNYRDENNKSFPFYVYVSLNARDSKRAAFLLMNKILGWIEEETQGVERSRMFKKLYGHHYSVLMMKECRTKSQKYFMLDIDTKNKLKLSKIDECLAATLSFEPLIQETRNGYHYKVIPFNRQKFDLYLKSYNLKDVCEVKIDANFFVEYIENKEVE
jgi:hypothetical protein